MGVDEKDTLVAEWEMDPTRARKPDSATSRNSL
jgi:hypothetical protein